MHNGTQLISPLWFKNSVTKAPDHSFWQEIGTALKKAMRLRRLAIDVVSAPSNPTPDAFDWFY
jgi:hypothetical protein